MFRPLRRARQALAPAACQAILAAGSSGVLAVAGDDGYPYAVPLSYVFAGGRLYFHCARAGHKLDAVRRCPKASFCVVAQDDVLPEKYTTLYRSVIVFGRVRELTDPAEQRAAALALAEKYAPEASPAAHHAEIDRYAAELCVLELAPEQITGKQCIELAPPAQA